MSSTRYAAEDDSEFHQEGLASSKGYSYGLNALIVAKRASVLRKAEDRELIWFLQEISHRLDLKKHRTANYAPVWPWETPDCELGGIERAMVDLEQMNGRKAISYDVEKLDISILLDGRRNDCAEYSTYRWSHEDLLDIALEPTSSLDFSVDKKRLNSIISILRSYKSKFESTVFPNFTPTAISNDIHRVLNYALSQRCMVLIEGNSRIGKSFAIQSWAQKHLGKVRYVQLQASNDEMSFYSCIAHALGLPSTRNYKALELRDKILRVLDSGDLMLIIDEADHLWPRTDRPRLAPARIDWINTALVNRGVPVALVGTPKFSLQLDLFDSKCPSWASEQFIGRLGDHLVLPPELPMEDLSAIARRLLPEISDVSLIVAMAMEEQAYVATLERVARKVRGLAAERKCSVNKTLIVDVCKSERKINQGTEKSKVKIVREKFISGSKVGESRRVAKNILSNPQILLPDSAREDFQESSLLP